jgi:hypothetical protein
MTVKEPLDPVRRYLMERGVRDDLVHEGLPGLVRRWTRIVHEVARGYSLTLDDYLNDMDIRDIIAGALAVADQKQRDAIHHAVEDADRKFRSMTIASLAENPENPPNPDRWWYSRRPARFLSS